MIFAYRSMYKIMNQDLFCDNDDDDDDDDDR